MRTVTDEEVYEIIKENHIYNKKCEVITVVMEDGTQFNKPANIIVHDKYPVNYTKKGYGQLDHADLRDVNFHSILPKTWGGYKSLVYKCNLEGSDLSGNNCKNIEFRNCNFKNADLRNCDFTGSGFTSSNMEGVLVDGANFKNADLSGAINPPDLPMACPREGEFVAYEMCLSAIYNSHHSPECIPVLVKLLIPEYAERSSGTSLTCQSSEAKVLDFEFPIGYDDLIKDKMWIHARSVYMIDFIYDIGKTVTSEYVFGHNRYRECTAGIHFYANREDAISLGLDYLCYAFDTEISRIFSFA